MVSAPPSTETPLLFRVLRLCRTPEPLQREQSSTFILELLSIRLQFRAEVEAASAEVNDVRRKHFCRWRDHIRGITPKGVVEDTLIRTITATDAASGADSGVTTPSAFMRGRRPTLYSDTLVESSAPLARDAFEYRLQTITARSEEAQFQRFVHALLEVEVCPNLVPQTGPTGGGDSKVDAETYAVADAIAERWWSGVAREAATEQWAFAISAMQDWRKKARQDIDNVLASGRTYQRIHFVTNQFVKDKDRAKIEQELTRRAGNIPVRVFDRTWIVRALYDHDHWPIAERELGLPTARSKTPGTIGPLDADRARQLAAVEAEIADPSRFANSPVQLAHAWLTSALLARGLGRAREEVDQRLDRAIEAGRRSGQARCLRRMLYQKVWTAYWWFDDYTAVIGGYDAIEALLDDDTNSWDLEQLTNLYTLLHSAEMHHWLPVGTATLEARRDRLRERLERLSIRRSHPTDAAWARTHLLQLNFLADPQNPQQHEETIRGFQTLLREVERLPEYPVESLCEVISVFAQLPFTIEGLDAIADRAGELVGKRLGAQAQARQLLDRAAHKVSQKAPEDALRLLGRAASLLQRQPSRELYLEGAWITAQAYCDVGLFCAARAHLLLGLNRSLRSVVEDAKVSGDSLSFALRLAWVELAAGRLPLVLEALHYADVMAGALNLSDKGNAAYLSERQDLEVLLSRSIAGSAQADAEAIRAMPAVLGARQLHLAEQVALALLGHPQEGLQTLTDGGDLAALQTVPWPADVGPIDWESGATGTIRSRILGCELRATGIATQEARSLAMTIFAAVEGFAATAFADRLAPGNDRLLLTLDDSQRVRSMSVSINEDEYGDPVVRLGFARGTLSAYAATNEFHKKLVDVVAKVISHVCTPGARTDLERMFSQDAVHDRAFGLLSACALDDMSLESPTLVALRPPDSPVADLIDGGRFQPPAVAAAGPAIWHGDVHTEEPPAHLFKFHHRHTRRVGAINDPLWNQAAWQGVGFAWVPGSVPGMYLMFRNADAAAKILRGWHRRVDGGDADRILRVAMITNVDKDHPAHYRVGIAPAEAGPATDANETLMIAVRCNTMTPEYSTNLDAFLATFAQHGRFRLGVAAAPADPRFPFFPLDVAPIELTKLEIKTAWQIEANDQMFGMMLRPDDDPYVPPAIEAPAELPVMRLIEAARDRGRLRTEARSST